MDTDGRPVLPRVTLSCFVLAAAGAAVSLGFSIRSGRLLHFGYAPWLQAVADLEHQVTYAHLRFEEQLGSTGGDIDEVAGLLAEGDEILRALEEGGGLANLRAQVQPLRQAAARRLVTEAAARLHHFADLTRARWIGRGEADSPRMDSLHDGAFADLLRVVEELRKTLQAHFHLEVQRFRAIQNSLGFAVLVLTVFSSFGFWNWWRQHRGYRAQLVRESRARVLALVEAVGDWVWEIDRDGVFRYVGPRVEELLGIPADELIGTTREELLSPEELDRVRRRLDRMRTGPVDSLKFECQYARRGGGTCTLESRVVPIFDDTGQFVGHRGLDRDVTVHRALEESRLALERRVQETHRLESLSRLAGGIAHDFNNLLVGVIGYADILRKQLPPDSTPRRLVAEILRAGQRAADLAHQMLAYSGRGRFLVEHVDLGTVVAETTPLLRASLADGVRLTSECAEGVPLIDADLRQLRQVLVELVSNASEALADSPGEITVRVRPDELDAARRRGAILADRLPEGPAAALEVGDSGPGMDEECRRHMFEPFYSTRRTGRGLGLAAVHGVVRGHRGAIEVESAPGAGTLVRILLPAVSVPAPDDGGAEAGGEGSRDEPLAVPATAASPRLQEGSAPTVPAPTVPEIAESELAESGGGSPATPAAPVLVVDDEDLAREVASALLEEAGFEVTAVASGRAALDRVTGDPHGFSAVILDLSMPVMGGEEVFSHLRQMAPGIPVLLASGYHQGEIERRFAGRGFAGFIQKPYRLDELLTPLQAAGVDPVPHPTA